jgi:hypothetical protein
MKRLLISILFFCFALPLMAQEVLLPRLYLVPMQTLNNQRFPKYFSGRFNPNPLPELADLYSVWQAFGAEPVFFICAPAISTPQHNVLSANIDVLAVPQDLDQPVSALALSTLQTKLEGFNIPADWMVANSMTYRECVRLVYRMFQLADRFYGISNGQSMFGSGVTLNTRWNQIPIGPRNLLQQIATEWGINTSGVTGQTTVRQLLKLIADQMRDDPIIMGGVTI